MSEQNAASPSANHRPGQLAVAVGALIVAGVLAYGATEIPSDAGYAGVGPNFLPWVISAALAVCGLMLLWEVWTGGYRNMPEPSGATHGDWRSLAWVSAGVLLNASLITTIGFILSCSLCFVLAVRGLRSSEGKPAGDLGQTVKDAVIAMVISAPVYWLFTKVLAVNLPGITSGGWI